MLDLPDLPPRPEDAHKGTFGRLLIIAGSEAMSGAARLSATAALRAGVGLLTVATPRCVGPIVASENPQWMTLPLEDAGGCFASGATERLREAWNGMDAVAIGPGLGQTDAVRELVNAVYRECPVPLVVDADGLNALAAADAWPEVAAEATRILTPHPGEFGRLTGQSVGAIQKDRVGRAHAFARDRRVVLVLKGPGTVITDGQQDFVNSTGNAALARGGTGDVLTGLIAGLVAQPIAPLQAARLGCHLHGLAAEIAVETISSRALLVTELLQMISPAWQRLEA